jgi:iron complex transport system ATP-binding protein
MNKAIEDFQVKHLSFAYNHHGGTALQDVCLSLPGGKYIALVGPNGSGKSTLLRLLSGSLPFQSGQVLYGNQDVSKLKPEERARQFAVVHQKEAPRFNFTVWEMVLLGLHPYRRGFDLLSRADVAFIDWIMELTDTQRFADQLVTQLSGGELQRVVLARALAQKPKVLFLDEAMSDLDICVKVQMMQILKGLVEAQGLTVIAIHHDLNTAYQCGDWLVALKDGRVTTEGQPHQVISTDFFKEVFNVLVEIYPGRGFLLQEEPGPVHI